MGTTTTLTYSVVALLGYLRRRLFSSRPALLDHAFGNLVSSPVQGSGDNRGDRSNDRRKTDCSKKWKGWVERVNQPAPNYQ